MVEVGVEQVHNPPHQPGRGQRNARYTRVSAAMFPLVMRGNESRQVLLLPRRVAARTKCLQPCCKGSMLSLRRFALASEGAAVARMNLSVDWLVRANCTQLSRPLRPLSAIRVQSPDGEATILVRVPASNHTHPQTLKGPRALLWWLR
eukprot:2807543-Pleurochrysis_carterae.AAC.3